MNIVRHGAEYAFLAFMEHLKATPNGWIACTFSFSRKMEHSALMSRRTMIGQRLATLRKESDDFLEKILPDIIGLPSLRAFQFADHDIILLCCPGNAEEQKNVRQVLERIGKGMPKSFCDYGFLTKELPVFQKIAEKKLVSAKKMDAYTALSDKNKLDTINLRRKKREEATVLIVEDDRFTANYLYSFLREFNVIVARNGEEAILQYIEHAPDAVFLDIHLPGMNGHQVLQGIRAADPEAYVVMLSVDTALSSIMTASENGATSYLKKPFTRERVLNTLRLSPYIKFGHGVLPFEQARQY